MSGFRLPRFLVFLVALGLPSSSLLVAHRVARSLEALVRAPAEAVRAAQAVPQEGRASLAALGDDLVQLVLQAEAAGGEQQRQRYRRVHDH